MESGAVSIASDVIGWKAAAASGRADLQETADQLGAERRRLVCVGAEVGAAAVAAAADYRAAVAAAERQLGPADNWSTLVTCADVIGSGVELRRVELRAGASEVQRLALALVAADLQQLGERWLFVLAVRADLQEQLRRVQMQLVEVHREQLAERVGGPAVIAEAVPAADVPTSVPGLQSRPTMAAG
jgi:hypothetical protein